MFRINDEVSVARILAIGSAAITLLVITGSVTDPVNSTKLALLGVVGTSVLAVVFVRALSNQFRINKLLTAVLLLFVLAMGIATAASDSPLGQNIYGTYGRNTGLLAYLFLACIFLAAASLVQAKSFKLISRGLLFSGFINVLYGLWVLILGDPINWNNPYGALLGTFGNPNFISSFLGIFAAAIFAYLIDIKVKLWQRLGLTVLLLTTIFQISETDSIQGYVVTVACMGFVLFIRLLNSKFRKISWLYILGSVVAAIFAILGVFKTGPLANYLYQGTMAFREQYWRAAGNMGFSSPFTGIGMDSYGDNYRLFREAEALTSPGVQVVSNSAHNVFLDIFSSGGVILFICYLILTVMAAVSLVRVLKRLGKYDLVFAIIASAWVGYQLQSLISINQIGLAIWGWLMGGALIGYEKMTRDTLAEEKSENREKKRNTTRESVISANLLAGIGAVVGALIAVPPLSADMAFASATKSGNFELVKSALAPSYLHPESSARIVNLVQILENSKLSEQAREFALTAVRYNPNDFNSWLALYSIQASTEEEKAEALENLNRLDPLNSDVTAK